MSIYVEKRKGILELLKSSLVSAPVQVKRLVYKTLRRPIMSILRRFETHTATHSTMLEEIQNRAVRFVKNIKGREISTSNEKTKFGLIPKQRAESILLHQSFD